VKGSTLSLPSAAVRFVRHHMRGLSTGKLAENMKEYAETQPDLQNKPVPGALLRYLISLCGTPSAQTSWQGW
jgi:hypothetical protein